MKEYLEHYYEYKARIKKLRIDLKREQNKEAKVSGSNFEINGDIRPKGYMSNNIENQIISKTDKIKEIEHEIEELEDIIELVDNALKTLKNNDRIAVQMRFFDKLEYDTIATTLGIVDAEQKVRNAVIKMSKIMEI